MTEKDVPPEHSSVVGALNYPPFPSHSAETLVACDPWKEEGPWYPGGCPGFTVSGLFLVVCTHADTQPCRLPAVLAGLVTV